MRVFRAVIDEGSFAAAARGLDMSAAAVTRSVTDIEDHLKTRLIHRTTRSLSLTDAGEAYLARVRSILADVDEAEAEAMANATELSGTVRVIATPILASLLLAPAMARWHEREPGVAIELEIDAFPARRIPEFDISLISVADGYDANVIARPLVGSDYVVCAAPSYLARHGRPRVPADLEGHGHLRFPWPSEAGASRERLRLRRADDAQGTVEVRMPVVLESLSHIVLHHAAIEGAGVAVLSRALIRSELASGRLVHLLPEWTFGHYTAYLAMPSRRFVPRRTRAFIELLDEFVRTRLTDTDTNTAAGLPSALQSMSS